MLSTQSVLLILLFSAYMTHVNGKIQNMPTESPDRNDYDISKVAKGSVALTWVGHRIGHDGAGLCCGRQGDFAPRVHGGVSQFAMFGSARPVAVNMEEIGDRAVD